MGDIEDSALSQLLVLSTTFREHQEELPLNALIKQKNKSKNGTASGSDQKKKKSKKKRRADATLEGEPKKKLKKKEPKMEDSTVKEEEDIKVEDSVKSSESAKRKLKKKLKKDTSETTNVSSTETTPEVKDEKPMISKSESEHGTSQNGDSSRIEEESDDYKWWEDEKFGQGPERWQQLEHNGVLFPPPYEPLPSYVKMYYDGKPVDLPSAAEEVAGFFGAMLESDHTKNPVFQKNFFDDFIEVLKQSGGCNVEIESFEKCDFSKMFAYFEKQKEEKKNISKQEKLRIKAEREALEEPYRTCFLNGRKENIGNFRVEPPGLFRGRGAHPKTGKLKKRVYPEDITLNLGADAPVPVPPAGHKWGAVKHDKSVVWLAMWRENIADNFKYVKLAANSSIKGVSDMRKFETARELKNHIERIRADYNIMLKDQYMQNRQIATATYLIDIFALRAGGEKGEDEADTVGCCSLRYEHVTLKPPNTVIFDFLGKDSIRFYQEVEVDRQVFKNFRIFKKDPKQPGDDLFDRISPSTLNRHLQGYMKGLTAKVFRTYNASKTMQDQMDLIKNEGTVAEKILKYNAANRTVAILCNHQRTVTKGHSTTVEKIQDRIKEMEWQKLRLKRMILNMDPSAREKEPRYFEELEDVSKEDLRSIVRLHVEKLKDQAKKKWTRDNEKRKMEEQDLLTEQDLDTKMKGIEELRKQYEEEVESGVVEPKSASVEKLKSQIETIEGRISNVSFQLKDKEDNSEVSLGTSKLNYIDPRLTVMFSKKFNVPIEKLFAKTLRDKFNWAIESTGADWRF
ncbi:hypothetical protein METBIDRAFT_13408 [Metschnikowia bicuspidata var. bicuspidata NRRL YB-4993]|uniref:DNA topoisomerase I n=1 Tax=Metschnikowia bicuspidata var. bicuspidata NRRL YB-4993 TaxID=869754 RepID=A0A1A0H6Y2_9ASCO|nr:hypothetical protein METBIDRAFT_13408 [Metschnikowia bicuspidata var. bicuspidata NRRL YB-4993]OBA19667.1 hypothetical protein METBIDRAFT_13408 [Metschnikowia bicuspidata var. bicuspidata NRRL YB-4993]